MVVTLCCIALQPQDSRSAAVLVLWDRRRAAARVLQPQASDSGMEIGGSGKSTVNVVGSQKKAVYEPESNSEENDVEVFGSL
ncbi:hypothetical protein NDU88_005479 [Pleurodeles waltl]|uniref:Uncharacterized protein n=1 Tax=Pleurodeles waltl TaxID=8319 RepID=A0AAV7VJZ8_PLEWA|nr:hypothetical protein NDU88_005479 [Pleurodeles waltl]